MKTARLIVDLSDADYPCVRISTNKRVGQWVEFYALLALTRTDQQRQDEFLTRERLYTMAQWHHGKTIESVGKEVSRELQKVSRRRGASVLECKEKTRAWRLRLPSRNITFLPSREAVVRWISTRTHSLPLEGRWIYRLEHLIGAMISVHTGDGDGARQQLRVVNKLGAFDRPELDAWAALIDARATDQYVDSESNKDALDPLIEHWDACQDAAGRSVAARIRARAALRRRFVDYEHERSCLSKLASALESRGDISALASVLNALGVLASRMSDPDEAIIHHLRAAALFGIIGDLNSLQAALFNLAQAHTKRLHIRGQPADANSIRLLEMCSRICTQFSVGRDSALAEISGCHWSIDLGDYQAARRYLTTADEILEGLDSAYEKACALLATARLEQHAPSGKRNVGALLRRAHAWFLKAGDLATAKLVDAMLRDLGGTV